jgi:hypothetical protein
MSSRNKNPFDMSGAGLGKVTVTWSKQVRQGFNLRVWMNNSLVLGRSAFDIQQPPMEYCNTGIGLEYPAGSCVEHLFGGGPMVGAIINGTRYVTEVYNGDAGDSETLTEPKDTLRNVFWFTSINDTATNPGRSGYYKGAMNRALVDDDGDGKIDEDPVDGIDNDGDWISLTDDIGADGIPDSLEVGCKGVYDAVSNPDPAFDNYEPANYDSCHPLPNGTYPKKNNKDKYTEKNGIPDHGEPHVDEDGAAISPSDYYVSVTDTARNSSVPTRHHKMGLKIIQRSEAWEYGTPADAITFLDYTFMNISQNAWQDAYIAMFLDTDVGPVSVVDYYAHNYAAYDTNTRTAYVNNPVDKGSTPLGLTLMGASTPLDSLKHIFQWFDFSTRPSPGTNDSTIYSWLNGDKGLIYPDQPADQCSDTRFFISNGPYQIAAGKSARVVYALVSGKTVADMLNNARRAREIYNYHGFIMPALSFADSGGMHDVTVNWNALNRSPFGKVTSYRLYYGTSSHNYTDSITTNNASVTVPRQSSGQILFFAVRGIDERGYMGALSDEGNTLPGTPSVYVTAGERSILLEFPHNTVLNFAGYNIYRRASDEISYIKLNSSPIMSNAYYPSYTDTAVWGDKRYFYKGSAVDNDGNESALSDSVMGRLTPPVVPANLVAGQGVNFIHLNWKMNTEGDFRGYDIFRRDSGGTVLTKLNNVLWKTTDYIDSGMHGWSYYYIIAVDTTDAVSDASVVRAHTVGEANFSLLIMNAGSGALRDSMTAFYRSLAIPYTGLVYLPFNGYTTLIDPLNQDVMETFKYVFWFEENYADYSNGYLGYPAALKSYLLGGGKALIMGRRLSFNSAINWYPFLHDIFGINVLTTSDITNNFIGALPGAGFPQLYVDQHKLDTTGGCLNYIDRLSGVSNERVIFTYHASPTNPKYEGAVVGARAIDTTIHAYYISMPAYYLDTASAIALVDKIMKEFGFTTGVAEKPTMLPTVFRLYQAYPNPFNPATTIRFDIPTAGDVSLKIYDVLGRKVAVLADGRMQPGSYEKRWNAGSLASGVYFYRLQTERFVETKKLLLMK